MYPRAARSRLPVMPSRNVICGALAALCLLPALAAPAAHAAECDPFRQNCDEPPPPPPPNEPPTVTITKGPTGATKDRNPLFGFTASDPEGHPVTVTCRFADTEAFQPCVSETQSKSPFADGSYRFSVRASDGVKTTTRSREYSVDTTAPSVTAKVTWSDQQRIQGGSVTFETTASDLDRYQCALPDETFQDCAATWAIPARAGQGSNHVLVRGVDEVGNVGAQVASTRWWLDTVAPVAAMIEAPPAFTNDNTPSFTFGAHPGDETIPYAYACGLFLAHHTGFERGLQTCTDGTDWTGAQSWPVTPDGEYRLAVRAFDAAGNAGPIADRTFVIDTRAPVVSFVPTSRAGMVGFAADEESVRFTCAIDRDDAEECNEVVSIASLSPGTHTVTVRGTDRAGNVSAPAVRTVVVDAPPVVDEKPPVTDKGSSAGDTTNNGSATTKGPVADGGTSTAAVTPAAANAPRTVVAPARKPAVKRKACFKTKKVRGKKKRVKVPCAKRTPKKRAAKKRR